MITNERKDQYLKTLINNIKQQGYQLTYISAQPKPDFCYSTGIYETYGIPELFISSLPRGLCAEIVENYIHLFSNNKAIPTNTKLGSLSDRFSIFLIHVPVNKLHEYTLSSTYFYKNREYTYLQVIYPDVEGNFPGEAEYNYDQEIIGEFES